MRFLRVFDTNAENYALTDECWDSNTNAKPTALDVVRFSSGPNAWQVVEPHYETIIMKVS